MALCTGIFEEIRSAVNTVLACGSITSQPGINFLSPRINSAGHAENTIEALLLQPLSNLQTAATMVTVHDDVTAAIIIQFTHAILDFAHGQQGGSLNVNVVPFVLFATIK